MNIIYKSSPYTISGNKEVVFKFIADYYGCSFKLELK